MTVGLPRLLTALPICLLLASCSLDSAATDPDPEIGETTEAVTGCTASNTGTGVCNVGLSSNGFFAVQYQNAWWSLDFASGYWSVENNVSATPLDVIPTQTVTVTNPCDSVCNLCATMTGSGQTACQNGCTSCRNSAPPSIRTESLKYSVAVNGLT